MPEITHDVEHRTYNPRTSEENTIECVEWRKNGSLRDFKFERVGECLDVWRFIEARINGETEKVARIALDPDAVYTILKETPCVEIRDRGAKTMGSIEYKDEIRE